MSLFKKAITNGYNAYGGSGAFGSGYVQSAVSAFQNFDATYSAGGAGGSSLLGFGYQAIKGTGKDLATGFATKALGGGGGGQPQGYQLPQQSTLPLNFQSGVAAARGRSTQTDAYFQNADPRVLNGIFRTLNSRVPTIKASVSRITAVTPSTKDLTTKLGTANISRIKK